MATYRIPKSAGRFANSINNVHTGDANTRSLNRAERDAAASTVRAAVQLERELITAGNRQDELDRVRRRIKAYCDDYPGLDELVSTLRARLRIPEQLPDNSLATQPAS